MDQVYLPDLLAIAPYYLEYAGLGEGLGNFLTWGEFPDTDNSDTSKFLVPRAVITGRDLTNIQEPDPRDFERMKEFASLTPGMNTPAAINKAYTPGKAKPISITLGRMRPTSSSKLSRNTPGLKPRAGPKRPWKLDRWRVC